MISYSIDGTDCGALLGYAEGGSGRNKPLITEAPNFDFALQCVGAENKVTGDDWWLYGTVKSVLLCEDTTAVATVKLVQGETITEIGPKSVGEKVDLPELACRQDAAGTEETTVDAETLAALGHQYGTPEYTWSDDNTSCTAKKVCAVCKGEVTENAAITSSVKTAATCTVMGTTTYTADFTDANGFTTQTKNVQDIPMIKHDWSNKDGVCKTCQTKCTEAHKPGTTCEVCGKYTRRPSSSSTGSVVSVSSTPNGR